MAHDHVALVFYSTVAPASPGWAVGSGSPTGPGLSGPSRSQTLPLDGSEGQAGRCALGLLPSPTLTLPHRRPSLPPAPRDADCRRAARRSARGTRLGSVQNPECGARWRKRLERLCSRASRQTPAQASTPWHPPSQSEPQREERFGAAVRHTRCVGRGKSPHWSPPCVGWTRAPWPHPSFRGEERGQHTKRHTRVGDPPILRFCQQVSVIGLGMPPWRGTRKALGPGGEASASPLDTSSGYIDKHAECQEPN